MKLIIKDNYGFSRIANEIIYSNEFERLRYYNHHKATPMYDHCIATALLSYKAVSLLHLKCDKSSLVRGALLHDFFLYDWHKSKPSNHTFSHPIAAKENAQKLFSLNEREKEIILCHMFPLCSSLPKHKEAYIVSISDKLCTLFEYFKNTFSKNKISYTIYI